jgi:hypothetical protein
MVRKADLKRIGALAIATTLLALTACGDDSGSGAGEAAGGDSGGSVTLTMTEAGCDPVSLSASAGSVEFAVTNESGLKGELEVISSAPEILTEEFRKEYIRPVGGGFYFALPGVASADGYLGEGLLSA